MNRCAYCSSPFILSACPPFCSKDCRLMHDACDRRVLLVPADADDRIVALVADVGGSRVAAWERAINRAIDEGGWR